MQDIGCIMYHSCRILPTIIFFLNFSKIVWLLWNGVWNSLQEFWTLWICHVIISGSRIKKRRFTPSFLSLRSSRDHRNQLKIVSCDLPSFLTWVKSISLAHFRSQVGLLKFLRPALILNRLHLNCFDLKGPQEVDSIYYKQNMWNHFYSYLSKAIKPCILFDEILWNFQIEASAQILWILLYG